MVVVRLRARMHANTRAHATIDVASTDRRRCHGYTPEQIAAMVVVRLQARMHANTRAHATIDVASTDRRRRHGYTRERARESVQAVIVVVVLHVLHNHDEYLHGDRIVATPPTSAGL